MFTFKKEERLCSKKLLEKLFNNGSSFFIYPFRIVSLSESFPETVPAQVVIGVSKRRYKHATDRNLIKRRIREAYRLNKEEYLYSILRQNNLQLILSVNYVGKDIGDYDFMEKKLIAAFRQLVKAYVKSVD